MKSESASPMSRSFFESNGDEMNLFWPASAQYGQIIASDSATWRLVCEWGAFRHINQSI